MPLLRREAPAGAQEVLREALPTVNRISGRSLAFAAEALPRIFEPHAAFAMTAGAVADRIPLTDAAIFAGWRYLIDHGANQIAIAMVRQDSGSGQHRFTEHNLGRFSSAAPAAIHLAEDFASKVPDDYELRFLAIPALHVASLWLKHVSGETDYFIPFGPVEAPLSAGQVYKVNDFLERLIPVARALIQLGQDSKK